MFVSIELNEAIDSILDRGKLRTFYHDIHYKR